MLSIPIADEPTKSLASFASRIDQLLVNLASPGDPDVVGSLDDLLGSIYSLILAAHHGFEDRLTRQIEPPVIKIRAEQVMQGNLRLEGKWIAGWHFNSALFRVAAVYHRLLKVLTGRTGNRPDLQREAERLYRSWTSSSWSNGNVEAVYKQVNTLKHDSAGVYHARDVTFAQGVSAVSEVLALLEAWAARP